MMTSFAGGAKLLQLQQPVPTQLPGPWTMDIGYGFAEGVTPAFPRQSTTEARAAAAAAVSLSL